MNNCIRPGISLFVKAMGSLGLLLIIDLITKDLVLSCLSILIVNILFILIYDFRNIKKIKLTKTKFSREANKRLFKAAFFTFILTILGLYLTNIQRYAIDDLLENSFQTIFGIIVMPATIMVLLAQYIIQPSLTSISNSLENKKFEDLKNIIKRLIGIIVFFGILVTVVAYFLELPVLEFIYGVELDEYFSSMMIIVIGSIFYGLITVLSAILIAMRKTFGQTIIYAVICVLSTILSFILVGRMSIDGASIAYFLTMFTVALIFFIYAIISMKKYKKQWQQTNI